MAGYSIDSSEVRHLALDLSKAPASVRAKAPAAVKRTLFAIEGSAKAGAPVDTGHLVNSIGTDVDGDGMGGVVGPTASYGDVIEYGSQPHIIRPIHGQFLKFTIAGHTIFAREVHHPGTAPQPYLGPAFDKHVPTLERLLGNVGEEIL
jgi:hypothetical protein